MKPNIERLEKLLAHMESGKLSVDRFDFNHYRAEVTTCGTAGCMAGELPAVFPKKWRFASGIPVTPGYHLFVSAAEKFFGLTFEEVLALFFGGEQHILNLPILPESATREQVAANLRTFIERKKAHE